MELDLSTCSFGRLDNLESLLCCKGGYLEERQRGRDGGGRVGMMEGGKWCMFYVKDTFGLRTLNETGRVKVFEIPGVQHLQWHTNQSVFNCCMEPYLN